MTAVELVLLRSGAGVSAFAGRVLGTPFVDGGFGPDTFRCGHPRSPENSASNGAKASAVCRECSRKRARERYARNLEASRAAGRARMAKHRGGLKGSHETRKTACPQGHPYDEGNTYLYKGSRQCKECRRVRVAESYQRHSERRQTDMREYKLRNPEAVKAANRRWFENNRERANLTSRLKKQRRRAAGNLTVADWRTVLNLYGNRCLACGANEVTIDHIVPISRGGRNTVDNVQPLCGTCNTRKLTKTVDYRPALAASQRT